MYMIQALSNDDTIWGGTPVDGGTRLEESVLSKEVVRWRNKLDARERRTVTELPCCYSSTDGTRNQRCTLRHQLIERGGL
jgi:hypothetical protein